MGSKGRSIIARAWIFYLVIQGLLFWQSDGLNSFLFHSGWASVAEATPPKVICVPQVPSDPLVPHDTWAGEPTILKGIARDPDNNLIGGTYYWDFGDGTQSLPASVTSANVGNLSITRTYTELPGTLVVARLYVTDAAGETASDEYRIMVREKTLDVEVNKAIDDALWWLFTNRATTGVYSIIPNQVLFTPDGEPGLLGEYFNNTSLSGTPVLTRVDSEINFLWNYSSPGTGVTADKFSVRWTGEIQIDAPGEFLFRTYTDDGIRVYIDDKLIISNWTTHGSTYDYSAATYLTSGRHDLRIEFFEATGGARMELYWASAEICRWQNYYSNNYTGYYTNPTASAVQAFEINGHLETGDPDENPYVTGARGGLAYLLTMLSAQTMTLQDGENPDSNANGIGLTVSGDRPIYELGAVMDAFVASGTPDAVANAGGANVIGRRYQDLVQDMVDMYAWGQVDSGAARGGWQYSWNSGSDNSAAQWGAIGMIAAERNFGCTVPQWVKTRNLQWLNYSYNSVGYFGYTNTSPNRALSTGPCGMVQLAFSGIDVSDSKWQACENYINNQWAEFIRSNRDCRYYSYYAFTKAMRSALQKDADGNVVQMEVTHLPGGLDWYGDETRGLARILVDRQNADGSWPFDDWPHVGQRTAAAWNVIILTRTLFEKPPVAVIHAQPNPGAVGQTISFDGLGSYHVDSAKDIVNYLWDFDASNGVDFDHPDAVGPQVTHAYGALGTYTVSLKVLDDSIPQRFDISTLAVQITIPPHPPTAVVGGPYVSVVGEPVHVDGSGSYDIDAGLGDAIIAWEWESDFIAPYDFSEAVGAAAVLPAFTTAGHKDIALRVTDNTAAVFPTAGQPNLTHTAFGRVMVYKPGVSNLAARPKETKCQLTWTHIGAGLYEVLRSEKSPNEGFALIGTTDSTYSTYIDYNVVLNRSYWYRIRCESDGETFLSGPVHMRSIGRIRNYPPEITSSPVTTGKEGVAYQYDVNAVDPEGLKLTYVLDQAPAGMTIDSTSGLITWTPTKDQAGLNDVTVRVNDPAMASDSQFFQIFVTSRDNTAPIAVPGGPYSGLTHADISFDASGSYDPEGDPIVDYRWVFGDGSEAHGQQVTHAYAAGALYVVTLYVTDDRGATGSAETTCQVDLPNRPPLADAGGPYEAEVGKPVTFDGSQSYDPDNDPMTYTWNFGDSTPAETGVQVSHTYATVGTYNASLSVDDGRGGLDSVAFTVTVTPLNQAPTAAFTVDGPLLKWATITFDGNVSTDPEGRPFASWQWDFGDGMATTGALVTHAYAEPGDYTVSLTVTDDRGLTDTKSQVLSVLHPPNNAPVVDAGGPYSGPVGTSISVTAGGDDPDGDTLSFSWESEGNTYSGQTVSIPFDTKGTYTVTLTVTDGYGGTAVDTASVLVYDPAAPGDVVPPAVSIVSPVAGESLVGTVIFTGSVLDDNLTEWRLEFAPVGSTNWVEIASGNAEINDGVLGQLDTMLLPDDFYRFRLTASDFNQSSSVWIECKAINPVKLGRFSLRYDDLRLPAMGLDLLVRRSYDSQRPGSGDFGNAWQLDLNTAEIREDANHSVFITLPDGRRTAFAFTPVPISPWFPLFEAKFTAPPGVFDTLDFVGNHTVVYSGGDWYFFLDSAGKFNPDTYILKTKFGRTYTISQSEGVKKVEDRAGNWVEIRSDGLYTNSARNAVFERDTDGRITKITDPSGYELRYAYDALGRLVEFTDQAGNITAYVYDGDTSRMLNFTTPGSCGPEIVEYYPDGRMSARVGAAGNRSEYSYDVAGRSETVKNPNGGFSTYKYDVMGNVIEVIDALGLKTLYAYDADGNLVTETLPSGQIVTYTYDTRGNKLTETREKAPGQYLTTLYTYNAFSQITQVARPEGDRVVYTYDADANLTKREAFDKEDNLISTDSYTYDAAGNRLSWQNALGGVTAYVYNSFGDMISETDPLGNTSKFSYDNNGNNTRFEDTLGNEILFDYDSMNRMIKAVHDGKVRHELTYDARGNLIARKDGLGNSTVYDYDCLGNRVRTTDAAGNTVAFGHDAMQNLLSMTDAMGQKTQYGYDAMNRQTGRIDGDGGEWAFDYLNNGLLSEMTPPSGAAAIRRYDDADRLVEMDRPELVAQYDFDDNTRLLKVEEGDGVVVDRLTTYAYETVSTPGGPQRQKTMTVDGKTIRYRFNAKGDRVYMQTPDGIETVYDYNAKGRVTKITTGSDHVDYGYDAAGRLIRMDFSNGASTAYTYDGYGYLTGVVLKDGSDQVIRSYGYQLDAKGQRTGITLNDGTVTYGLDALGRLTSESVNSTKLGTFSNSFSYDAAGNRLTPGIATYGPGNRLTGVGTDVYGYDANGNIISRGTKSYVYNSENRLVNFGDSATGQSVDYAYDHLGRRISKNTSIGLMEYLYDGEHIVCEYFNGTLVGRYTHGPRVDEVLMVRRGGNTYFYQSDGLGSVVAITDSGGNVVQEYGYDAWGNITLNTGSFGFEGAGLVNTFTYTGREYDVETGLYHYRARAYDPAIGRFLQKDPLQGNQNLTQSLNLYAYALNNPVNMVDPSGEQVLLQYTVILLWSSGSLGAPSHNDLAAALAGFAQGFATTNIMFLASYMEVMLNPYDIQTKWDEAERLTLAKIERVKAALGLASDPLGGASDPMKLFGIPGSFKSGASIKVGFSIKLTDKDPDYYYSASASEGPVGIKAGPTEIGVEVQIGPSGGGYENGVAEGLNYIRQFRPK